jgi:hypothetical protein
MPDDLTVSDDDTDTEPKTVTLSREAIRGLEEKAAEGDKLKREMAFTKAGVSYEDPKAKYFVEGYKGEMTPEAIKAEALTIGLIGETPAPPAPGTQAIGPEAEPVNPRVATALAAADRMQAAGTGAAGGVDLNTQMASASSPEEVIALAAKAGVLSSRQ